MNMYYEELKRLNGFMSVEDLANKFDVSIKTIYRWKNKYKIPYIKLGNRSMFDQIDIRNCLSSKLK